MSEKVLQDTVEQLASELQVPGVAVGVVDDAETHCAVYGVTSIDNPLPVDHDTLFQFGSTGKTYTATAILRLVEQGEIDLDAPVRTYVPELSLKDEQVAARVTVLQLLNHTAGWQGDLLDDTGDGDDALVKYVARMKGLDQVTPLGTAVSYNNASLVLAGRMIEKVAGTTFERAMRDLVLEPLGLDHTFFFMNDIMTRRFAVGHTRHDDGRITIARPWSLPRSGNPAGGMSASLGDQIGWARFHLGDGTAPDGTRILSKGMLRRMQQPTADMAGSALGDHVGITWLIRDKKGERIIGHGGTTNGQLSEFTMVPARRFALVSLTNCTPNGGQFNRELVRWAHRQYLELVEDEPRPLTLSDETLAEYAGRYETIAAVCDLTIESGHLLAKVTIKPEAAAAIHEEGSEVPEQPPIPLALVEAEPDRYVVIDGPAKGMEGYFSRDGSRHVDGVHLGGRLARRTTAVPA